MQMIHDTKSRAAQCALRINFHLKKITRLIEVLFTKKSKLHFQENMCIVMKCLSENMVL